MQAVRKAVSSEKLKQNVVLSKKGGKHLREREARLLEFN